MKALAILVFTFATFGISMLSIEAIFKGGLVTDVIPEPECYVVQMRSKFNGTKLNSVGTIVSTTWAIAPSAFIHTKGVLGKSACVFMYTASPQYNNLNKVYHGMLRKFQGPLAMVKANTTFIETDGLQIAPIPTSKTELYQDAIAYVSGYGPVDESSDYSTTRNFADNLVIKTKTDYPNMYDNEMAIFTDAKTTGICIGDGDNGIVYVTDAPGPAVVGFVTGSYYGMMCKDNAQMDVGVAIQLAPYIDWITATKDT